MLDHLRNHTITITMPKRSLLIQWCLYRNTTLHPTVDIYPKLWRRAAMLFLFKEEERRIFSIRDINTTTTP